MTQQDRSGVQGWRQFLTAKRNLVERYRSARRYSEAKAIAVSHGTVAEADFRAWLSKFLPRRFGVTSGFVVSQGLTDREPLLHYDVIIYDELNSPVLWVEPNADQSEQGNVRAIPAEYVHAVMEVKSRLTLSAAIKALQKLEKLRPLLGLDNPGDPYPKCLPADFTSHAVFFELNAEDARRSSLLDGLIPVTQLRGYAGGIVLSGEGLPEDSAGLIRPYRSETPMPATGESFVSGFVLTSSIEYSPKVHQGLTLQWSDVSFAEFAFDLLAMLAGKFIPGRASSFHGMSFQIKEPRMFRSPK